MSDKEKKVTKPNTIEINDNPRARSAHLRYVYRTSAPDRQSSIHHSFKRYGGVSV